MNGRIMCGVVFLGVFLGGCAGSPARTSMLSPQELQVVDDYTLCKAATPREFYSPSGNVMAEVQRRRLSCGGIYQYTPIPAEVYQAIQPAPPPPPPAPPRRIVCTTSYGVTTCTER